MRISKGSAKPNKFRQVSYPSRYGALVEKMFARFPNLKYQGITFHESDSARHDGWSAGLYNGDPFLLSQRYEITDIVDRVGVENVN